VVDESDLSLPVLELLPDNLKVFLGEQRPSSPA
jgi:hypothetical protein